MGNRNNKITNFLLFSIIVILLVLPLYIKRNFNFEGTDGQAVEIIKNSRPELKPWFGYLWEPPDETATLLFSLQAGLGAGIVCYIIGYYRGKRERR